MKIQILDVKQGTSNRQVAEKSIDISEITRRLTVTPGKLFLNEENDQILLRPTVWFRAVNGQNENIFSIEAEYMVFFRLTGIGEQTPEQVLSGNHALIEKLHKYSQIAVGVHLQMELNLTAIDSGMPIWEGEYIES
ncbi:hypothetical protein A7P92_06480 [Eikenella corrodens]|jgi:hypothetical protein|uniref:hypothetical protein n=1 Tax=Eikenella corrodens TaxID=539 RepID=UPI0007D098A2|nr:hypothetical protein [Eikenella corrodens]OAM23718.1 hypothetical protein A7P92_06480 [Eikenella corrodens]DAK14615.1 MAG TPA: hypothetical protein [Caudoviricetes sp.]